MALTEQTHVSIRFRALAAGAVLCLGLGLTACGGSDATTTTESASATETTTPAETPAETPTETETETETPTPTPTASVITDLSGIEVEGGFGQEVTLKANWPIQADTTLSEVLIKGEGIATTAEGWTSIQYTGYNGRTGEIFDTSFYRGSATPMILEQTIAGFKDTLTDKKVGDRVLIAITGADGYDSQGGQASADIQVGDTLVFLVDIVDAQRPGPTGEAVPPAAGLPTVADVAGVPTVTIPADASAPENLVMQVLIQGDGATVGESDAITVNYVEVDFATGEVLESNYESGAQSGVLKVMIEGWVKGLVGQKVGSRIMLVVPPELAYPDGDPTRTPTMAPGLTLVYVVDILFTQPYDQA